MNHHTAPCRPAFDRRPDRASPPICALPVTAEFGMLPALMRLFWERAGFLLFVAAIAIAVTGVRRSALADPPPDWELPNEQEELVKTMSDTARKFGPDVVLMQAYLLNEAVRNGSIGEATVSAPTVEDRAGKKFVAIAIDTGIVFNDGSLASDARAIRVWQDIIERALRRYSTVSVPADGLALTVRYHHKTYADEAEVRANLPERGEPEALLFYLLTPDVNQLVQRQATAQDVVKRSSVLRNGEPCALQLPPDVPPTSAQP